MSVNIRRVRNEDLEAVTRIEAICFPKEVAAPKEVFKERIATYPERFLVAEEEGEIIGFINGAVVKENHILDEQYEDITRHEMNGDYQAVFGLVVLPQRQGQKVATKLMEALIELAKNEKRKGVILTCKEELIGFYRRFGYVKQGISKSTHGNQTWYDMRLEW